MADMNTDIGFVHIGFCQTLTLGPQRSLGLGLQKMSGCLPFSSLSFLLGQKLFHLLLGAQQVALRGPVVGVLQWFIVTIIIITITISITIIIIMIIVIVLDIIIIILLIR